MVIDQRQMDGGNGVSPSTAPNGLMTPAACITRREVVPEIRIVNAATRRC